MLYPDTGNGGIYLRGRYEIRVGTEGGCNRIMRWEPLQPLPRRGRAELALGSGRRLISRSSGGVTVLRDGKMYHNNAEIGPSGARR